MDEKYDTAFTSSLLLAGGAVLGSGMGLFKSVFFLRLPNIFMVVQKDSCV